MRQSGLGRHVACEGQKTHVACEREDVAVHAVASGPDMVSCKRSTCVLERLRRQVAWLARATSEPDARVESVRFASWRRSCGLAGLSLNPCVCVSVSECVSTRVCTRVCRSKPTVCSHLQGVRQRGSSSARHRLPHAPRLSTGHPVADTRTEAVADMQTEAVADPRTKAVVADTHRQRP